MGGTEIALIGAAATILAALIGYLGARLTRQSQRETATDARWQAMLESQRKHFESLLDPMRQQIADLEENVGELKTELRTERGLFKIAMRFIRELLSFVDQHVPGSHPPQIPAELADDL